MAAAICLVLSTLPVSVLIPAPGAGLGLRELGVVPRVAEAAVVGTITTVAGTGTAGFSGDGGPATSAQLNTRSS